MWGEALCRSEGGRCFKKVEFGIGGCLVDIWGHRLTGKGERSFLDSISFSEVGV